MRAFLAIPLPDDVRKAALAAKEQLAVDPAGWRFAREEGLHVTLRFLGEADGARLAVADPAFRAAAAGTGPLAIRVWGAASFPARGRPRVLWLGVEDQSGDRSLSRLADRLEHAARASGFSPDDRPFAPHVTLARVRGVRRVGVPPVERVGDCGRFVADRVVLYRSELGPGGSRYHEVASYPLTVDGAP